MALILQFQRRAIESLKRHIESRSSIESEYSLQAILSDNLVIGDVRPLTILGISKGVGTCSDVSGMDVLVLSDNPQSRSANKITLSQIKNCAYAVLACKSGIHDVKDKDFNLAVNTVCVELLRLTDVSDRYTKFIRTGRRACYPAV